MNVRMFQIDSIALQ